MNWMSVSYRIHVSPLEITFYVIGMSEEATESLENLILLDEGKTLYLRSYSSTEHILLFY